MRFKYGLFFGLLLTGQVVLSVLVLATPSLASAAECSNIYVGPAEGSWATASNWSAGHTPNSTDVACVGSGKIAKITSETQQASILQGEGTVKLAGGTLKLLATPGEGASSINSLIQTGGTLSGAGTLNITSSYSTAGATGGVAMVGTGRTVIKGGASAEVKLGSGGSSLTISERTFVNEGTLTFTVGNVYAGYGALIENTGTFRANSEPTTAPAFRWSLGEMATIINSGTFEKSAGTGSTVVELPFNNNGAVEAKSGILSFNRGGTASAVNGWTAASGAKIGFGGEGTMALAGTSSWSGDVEFSGGSVSTANGFVDPAASIKVNGGTLLSSGGPVEAASLSLSSGKLSVGSSASPSKVGTFSQTGGTLTGSGTLNITSTYSTGGSNLAMSGSGRTVILPGAVGELKMSSGGGSIIINERAFVNEGSLTFAVGNIYAGNNALIENIGTFRANSEPESVAAFRYSGGGMPQIVNGGSFTKSSGTGSTIVELPMNNNGTVEAKGGQFAFKRGGSATSSNSWTAAGGAKIVFAGEGSLSSIASSSWTGDFEFNSGATVSTVGGFVDPGASIKVNGGTLNVSGGAFKATSLTMPSGTLNVGTSSEASSVSTFSQTGGTFTGTGTLNVTSSYSTAGATGGSNVGMAGSGRTVIRPGATATLKFGASSGTFNLFQRRLVNEGTLTFTDGNIYSGNGATIENTGTFRASSETVSYPAFRYASGAMPQIVNSGNFEKTAGTGSTVVDINVENLGSLKEASGKLQINHPIKAGAGQHQGHNCKTGDPVECSTGDFTESQTDFAIGGRGIGLILTRTYSAQAAASATAPGAFGYGWTNSFGDRLTSEESGLKMKLTQADGGIVTFTQKGSSWVAPSWSQDTLIGSSSSGFVLTLPDQTTYRFSGAGQLEAVTDRNGNETTLAYEAGRLKTVTDPAGRQLSFTYTAAGQVESVKDPLGNLAKYAYESGNLTSVSMPGETAPRWQFKYGEKHRIKEITDGRGGKTTNEYDSSSRVVKQIDPAGRETTFEYAPFHTKITNKATGAVTDEWFTSNNQPFSVTHGFGTAAATTQTYTYDTAGHLLSATDGNGHTTTFGYDEAGNLTSKRDPLGHETKWSFDAAHELISTTTPRGETASIKRDGDGNIESISRPAPGEETQTTVFAHDEHGQLESLTDPLGRTWSYGYDSYGDRTSETDPLGHEQTSSYDADSRLISITTPRGNLEGAEPVKYTTAIDRDARGRPLKVTDPLGNATKYAYDGNSNLASVTDAKGRTTKYTYNADDERTKVEKPNGATVQTAYDGAGAISSQTDGNGKTTTYARNVLEQPVEVFDPLGRKTTETFDAAGNLTGVIDPAGRNTSYSYDAAGRLTGVNYSEEATPDASLEYDADGSAVAISDGTGKSSFAYDQLGRLTRSEDGSGAAVEYIYDLGEQQTGVVYPNGKAISRTYDAAGHLESLTDWLGGTTSFGYDADSNLTGIAFPAESGNVDEYAYDPVSRMSAATFKKGPETLASLSYVRDALGQVEKEARSGLPGSGEVTYGYDQNNRLTGAGSATFEYDAADNLTKGIGSTNSYDAASQLEAGTGITYTYDKLGERTKATPASGPATSYGYDQAGNLTSIARPEEGEVSAIAETMTYDATGLLATKTSGLMVQHFNWDQSAELPLLLADDDSSYVYGPNDLPIEQISLAEAPTYLHHDQLGSTRMLTDGAGEASATFSYAPYGGLEGRTGSAASPLGFAGQYTDSMTGLQYLRARFYDPGTAQFLTRDPLAAVTRSSYGYGNENPMQFVDPSGMECGTSVGIGPVSIGLFVPDICDEQITEQGSSLVSDHPSLVIAPVVAAICVFEPDSCTLATLGGAGAGTGINGLKELYDPCFNFLSTTLKDLLVTIAAGLPGGVFEVTAGRSGPELSPVARRLLQILLDAPGVGAEAAHGAKSP